MIKIYYSDGCLYSIDEDIFGDVTVISSGTSSDTASSTSTSGGTTISLERAMLLFSVSNTAHIITDSIPDEEGTHDLRICLLDLMEDGNIVRVTELLDLGFSDICIWLDKYLDGDTDGDVDIDVTDSYDFELKKKLSPAKKRALYNYFREYMVAYVLWWWLLHKGFFNQAQPWKAQLDTIKEQVKDILATLNGGLSRRPLNPF